MKAIISEIEVFLKKKKVKEAYIFGSASRGDFSKRSDIDLIIIMETEKPFFERYDDFMDLILSLPYRIDLLIYTPKEWEEIKDRLFFRRVMREAKRIA